MLAVDNCLITLVVEEPEYRVDDSKVDFALVVDHELENHVVEVLRRFEVRDHLLELVELVGLEFEPAADVEVVGEKLPQTEDVLGEARLPAGCRRR